MTRTLEDRFWAKVGMGPNGCHVWLGATSVGYGKIGVGGLSRHAHIVGWEMAHGPVPTGLELDHLCKNPRCVRVGHLEPITHNENVRRGRAGEHHRVKTHCPQGHPYEGSNLIMRTTPRGTPHRACRTCNNSRKKAR